MVSLTAAMRPLASRAWLAGPILAGGLLSSACQSGPAPLTIGVQSASDANQGRPLQMVVRMVDQGSFLGESYQDAAGKVTSPDDSVLSNKVIFPGSKIEIPITRQDKKPVGVYFFFTTPANGTSWKKLIVQPLPNKVEIELQGNGIGKTTPP
jgi:hypothetical protein